MSRRLALVFALVSLAACASRSAPSVAPAGPPATSTTSAAAAAAIPSTNVARPRDVARTANVRLRAARPASVVEAARRWAEAHEGFVDDSSTIGSGGVPAASRATFRVPTSRYPEALRHFRALATVLEVAEHGEDVTLARADADARIGAKRALEQRLVALTAHTGTVAELIQVENELGRVRGDIEAMEASQRALLDRVAYATITLSAEAPDHPLVARAESFGSRLDRSFTEGVRVAESLVAGIVAFVTALSPLVLLSLVAWAGFRISKRRASRAVGAA